MTRLPDYLKRPIIDTEKTKKFLDKWYITLYYIGIEQYKDDIMRCNYG